MIRLLATIAAAVTLVATSASAFDPAHLKRLMETNECKGCELSNANLLGAKLRGAILVEAILASADLRNTILREANITGANLGGADLTGYYIPPPRNENGFRLEGYVVFFLSVFLSRCLSLSLSLASSRVRFLCRPPSLFLSLSHNPVEWTDIRTRESDVFIFKYD